MADPADCLVTDGLGTRDCRSLQLVGADVDGPVDATFNGLDVELYPRVSWTPLFALTFDDLRVSTAAASSSRPPGCAGGTLSPLRYPG